MSAAPPSLPHQEVVEMEVWWRWRCGGHIATRYVSRLNTAEINPPLSKNFCKGFALQGVANGYCNVSNNALENSNQLLN